MSQPRQSIEQTKRRFFIYSALGLLMITIVSISGLVFYNEVAKQQETVQLLNEKLGNQLRLINDIAILSDSFDKEEFAVGEIDALKGALSKLIIRLKRERSGLDNLFDKSDIKTITEIQGVAEEREIFEKLNAYLERAGKLVDGRRYNVNEIREDISFLSKTSQFGLKKVYRFINKKLRKEQDKALNQLRIVGTILIIVCVSLIIAIWALVFRPLYNEVIVKHRDLTDALIKADMSSRSKTDFLANISHEIRTPMTAILGYADLMKKDDLTDNEKKESIRVINQNAKHLLGLIDEILDISKIEAGKLTFEKEAINLNQTLSEVYSLINVKAEEKGIDLFFNSKGDIPDIIISDEKRLKQVLFNIVGNAIKFTPRGYVELSARFLESQRKLEILVKDTGIGIPKKSVSKLFRPFAQADTSGSRKHQGTGLGLVLSKQIARGLGGDVTIKETSLNNGSVFEITIDTGVVTSESSELELAIDTSKKDVEVEIDLKEKRVLVVDDAKENARLFKIYLEAANAKIDLAHDGHGALKKVSENEYDMIFMDLQMPGMDGFQAIRALRKLPYDKPIVALTAHALNEEVVKTRKAGFDDHVSKPVTANTLVETCARHLKLI